RPAFGPRRREAWRGRPARGWRAVGNAAPPYPVPAMRYAGGTGGRGTAEEGDTAVAGAVRAPPATVRRVRRGNGSGSAPGPALGVGEPLGLLGEPFARLGGPLAGGGGTAAR